MLRTIGAAVTLLVLTGSVWAADAPAVYDKKCKSCHSIAGVAGPMAKLGGPLDGVGSKRDEAWLRAYLTDPKSKMPKLPLSAEDMDAVVKYMLSLKK